MRLHLARGVAASTRTTEPASTASPRRAPSPPNAPLGPVRPISSKPRGWTLPAWAQALLGPRPSSPKGSPELAALAAMVGNPELGAADTATLKKILDAFGPAVPADNIVEPVPVTGPLQGQVFDSPKYDEWKDGKFSVPGHRGVVDLSFVLAQPDPAAFIKSNLSVGKQGRPGELCVFIPGLNTPEAESERRLTEQYSPVLGDLQMAHLHLGTDADQGDIDLEVSSELADVLRTNTLKDAAIVPSVRQEGAKWFAHWDKGQRDRVEAVLVGADLLETSVMRSTISLLEAQLEGPNGPQDTHLQLYSRGSIDGSAALRKYVAEYIARHGELSPEKADAEVKGLLRKHVVVETFGNADQRFIDGPMYLHWSATNDPLTSAVGATKARPAGGGKDALFLHYDGIFKGFDAHNFGAVGAVAVQLTLTKNGCPDARALWEQSQAGIPVVMPSPEELRAGIGKAKGEQWLWDPAAALA